METLYEVGGALAGLWVAWSYATGGGGLTVDQSAALVVAAVILARVLTQAARRYWYYHYEQQLHLEFPPDRLVIFLCNMIRAHRTLPCFLELERLEQKKNMSLNYVQTEEQELFP